MTQARPRRHCESALDAMRAKHLRFALAAARHENAPLHGKMGEAKFIPRHGQL